MAREALQSGDRILAENYLQHADHFQRLVNDRQGKPKDATAPKQVEGAGAEHAKAERPKTKPRDEAPQPVRADAESKPPAKEPERKRAEAEPQPRKSATAKGEPKPRSQKRASKGNGAAAPEPADRGDSANDSDVGEPSLQGVAFLNPKDVRAAPRKGREQAETSAKENSPKAPTKAAGKTKSAASGKADEAAG